MNKRCFNCDRYIKIKVKESSNFIIRCEDRKCKKDNTIKVVMMSDLWGKRKTPEPESEV